ncbi:hypothetical protein JCM8097_006800 [Rhodosporidiobolus ruineniae]
MALALPAGSNYNTARSAPLSRPRPLPGPPLSLAGRTASLFPSVLALIDLVQSTPYPPRQSVQQRGPTHQTVAQGFVGETAVTGDQGKEQEREQTPAPGVNVLAEGRDVAQRDDFGGGFDVVEAEEMAIAAGSTSSSERASSVISTSSGTPVESSSSVRDPSSASPAFASSPSSHSALPSVPAPSLAKPTPPPGAASALKRPRPAPGSDSLPRYNPFVDALARVRGDKPPPTRPVTPPVTATTSSSSNSGTSATRPSTAGRLAAAAPGGGDYSLAVIHRQTSAKPESLAVGGRSEEAARKVSLKYLEHYEGLGKKLVSSIQSWQVDIEQYRPHPYIIIGGGRARARTWRVPDACALPLANDASALFKALPTTRRFGILGADGVTCDPTTWHLDVLPHVRDDAEFAIRTSNGKGQPLLVEAKGFKTAIRYVVDGESVPEDTDDDIKEWLRLMGVGRKRRKRETKTKKDNGGELFRGGRINLEASGLGAIPIADRAAANGTRQVTLGIDKTSTPPRDIEEYVRCGRNDCVYCQVPARVEDDWHRDKEGSYCYGRCSEGCIITEGGAEGLREHYRKQHPDIILCPVPGCTVTVTKACNLPRHLVKHEEGTCNPDGRTKYGWLTWEMRLTAIPFHPEPADSPFPDRSDELPAQSILDFLPDGHVRRRDRAEMAAEDADEDSEQSGEDEVMEDGAGSAAVGNADDVGMDAEYELEGEEEEEEEDDSDGDEDDPFDLEIS